jgi:enoyl-CoA hydratase/carnithine racemase
MGLAVEHINGIVRIALGEPQRRNPLSLATLRELISTIEQLDDRARVIVIAAEGPVFSAGHDLREVAEHREDEAFIDELLSTCADAMLALQRSALPTIAEVSGLATAAGCQLVAASDLAIAATTARFATPGVNIGLFCTTPAVPLSRVIGRKRALEMLFTGTPIDATTALDWGLVNRVVEPEHLTEAVMELAASIATSSRHTLAVGKQAFYSHLALDEPAAYKQVLPVMSANARDDVAGEGIDAFLGKRQPQWPR